MKGPRGDVGEVREGVVVGIRYHRREGNVYQSKSLLLVGAVFQREVYCKRNNNREIKRDSVIGGKVVYEYGASAVSEDRLRRPAGNAYEQHSKEDQRSKPELFEGKLVLCPILDPKRKLRCRKTEPRAYLKRKQCGAESNALGEASIKRNSYHFHSRKRCEEYQRKEKCYDGAHGSKMLLKEGIQDNKKLRGVNKPDQNDRQKRFCVSFRSERRVDVQADRFLYQIISHEFADYK